MKKTAEYYKQYYQNNKERIKAYRKGYRQRTESQKRKNWRKQHKLKEISQNIKWKEKVSISPIELFGMLKKQKLLCPLTGRKLTNENISLDHIIPKVKGGLTEIANLRFVVNEVNKAKGMLSDTELIDLCKDILKTAKA